MPHTTSKEVGVSPQRLVVAVRNTAEPKTVAIVVLNRLAAGDFGIGMLGSHRVSAEKPIITLSPEYTTAVRAMQGRAVILLEGEDEGRRRLEDRRRLNRLSHPAHGEVDRFMKAGAQLAGDLPARTRGTASQQQCLGFALGLTFLALTYLLETGRLTREGLLKTLEAIGGGNIAPECRRAHAFS